ncbi:MAG: CRISPR-associated protein Cas4 [Elusimicrobia bacterium]|nr:CRISPR-associated protein Cas4 [Elusimicrobiota bacterium]
MYTDDDYIPLSALQHFLFCERQCALIHIEQMWEENVFTAEGRIMHENAHEEKFETIAGMRIERGLPLRSQTLGLNGKADVVEFHKKEDGRWNPFPVEYKHGKPKINNCDKVQLCAQAICLEEMLGVNIPAGALFYGKTRHRLNVEFDNAVRLETQSAAQSVHELIRNGKTPKPVYEKKCEACSLLNVCMPKTFDRVFSVTEYLREYSKG